jgi:hypothetical protein
VRRKADWLFDLDVWRREFPEGSFHSFLQECKSLLYKKLPLATLKQLLRWQSHYEAERTALLKACPYIGLRWQPEPEDPEEQEFQMCEMILPILRLQLFRRRPRIAAAQDTAAPATTNQSMPEVSVFQHSDEPELIAREGTLVSARAKGRKLTPKAVLKPESAEATREFAHSDDYTSVTKPDGQHFTLTKEQGRVIERLHKAWVSGDADVSKSSILKMLERETSRLQDIFRSTPGAWKALIKSTRRGVYRLKLPDPRS